MAPGLLILVLGFVLLHGFYAHLPGYFLLAAGNAGLIGGIVCMPVMAEAIFMKAMAIFW